VVTQLRQLGEGLERGVADLLLQAGDDHGDADVGVAKLKMRKYIFY
jgi:hypothetical protein